MEINNKNTRKEYKFLFSRKEVLKFRKFYGDSLTNLYPNRTIKSMYMDTNDLRLYSLSKQTDVDKFKLRYRTYPNSDAKIYREVKSNNSTGKEKTSKVTSFTSFEEINFDVHKNYFLTPSLFIKYEREYFQLDSAARLTIDSNLQFNLPKNVSLLDKYMSENLFIVELKILENKNYDLTEYFLNSPVAFSKYDYGIERIYNRNLIQN
tara:strand:+ start:480 stop:1100 length:621 start_codon:yes stop_codon:yes gene_type:complete